MTTPRVSVVMPVYNVEAYVLEAVTSVLNQNWRDLELLIVDDGGPDDSVKICRGLNDPRIRIISQENRGLAGARNTGIRHARGEFIAFLDADDRWAPQKLARHVAHLDASPDVGVSYSGSRLIDEAGRPIGLNQTPKLDTIRAEDVFLRNPVGNGSAPVIRRAVFDDIAFASWRVGESNWFDEDFRQSEDIECWMRIALTTDWRFAGVDGLLTEYRVNESGLSANIVRQFDSWDRMRAKVRAADPAFERRWGARAEAFQLRYLARRAVRMRDRGLAFDLVIRALGLAPFALLREPMKTATSLGAAAALRVLPEHAYAALERTMMPRPQSG